MSLGGGFSQAGLAEVPGSQEDDPISSSVMIYACVVKCVYKETRVVCVLTR